MIDREPREAFWIFQLKWEIEARHWRRPSFLTFTQKSGKRSRPSALFYRDLHHSPFHGSSVGLRGHFPAYSLASVLGSHFAREIFSNDNGLGKLTKPPFCVIRRWITAYDDPREARSAKWHPVNDVTSMTDSRVALPCIRNEPSSSIPPSHNQKSMEPASSLAYFPRKFVRSVVEERFSIFQRALDTSCSNLQGDLLSCENHYMAINSPQDSLGLSQRVVPSRIH